MSNYRPTFYITSALTDRYSPTNRFIIVLVRSFRNLRKYTNPFREEGRIGGIVRKTIDDVKRALPFLDRSKPNFREERFFDRRPS